MAGCGKGWTLLPVVCHSAIQAEGAARLMPLAPLHKPSGFFMPKEGMTAS